VSLADAVADGLEVDPLALISAIRSALSGTTLIRPIPAKSPVDRMTSAVPSQLFPTNITSRRPARVSGAAEAVAAGAATVRARAAATAPRCLVVKAGMLLSSGRGRGVGAMERWGDGARNLNTAAFRVNLLQSKQWVPFSTRPRTRQNRPWSGELM
jgi:hypothetical protein